MMCYRDMTFCKHWENCAKAQACPRPLTPDVLADAEEWWGKPDAPIAVFVDQPDCHEEVTDERQT